MRRVWEMIKKFYYTQFQKTIATVLGTLAFVDLSGYRDSIEAFLGAKGYAATRLVGAAAIIWRASQVGRQEKKDDAKSDNSAGEGSANSGGSGVAGDPHLSGGGGSSPPAGS